MAKLILITGGSASGKTHLANLLKDSFGSKAVLLAQDSFYKPGGDDSRNYDEPQAFDFETQELVLQKLLNNEGADIPIYDFSKHDVVGYEKIKSAEYILFEGLFTFHDYKIAKLADFKIFVHTPADTRLSRRILRDVKERGREIDGVINRWLSDVQPSYVKHIAPLKRYSDLIIPWHKINRRTLRSISQSIVLLDHDANSILEILESQNKEK